MFDDYVLYLLESLHCQERANELMRAMKGEGSTGKPALPWALLLLEVPFVPLLLLCFFSSVSQRMQCGERGQWCGANPVVSSYRVGTGSAGLAPHATMVVGIQGRV